MTDAAGSHPRVLNRQLASLLADLRHGEMICIADAGMGTGPKAIVPLDPSVERIDLGVVTGVPLVTDLIDTLVEVAPFEAAIVGNFTVEYNEPFHEHLKQHFGAEGVYEVQHFPHFYRLRDRARAFIQTGDPGSAVLAILVAGHPSARLPLEWLESDQWYQDMVEEGGTFVVDDNGSYRRKN